MQLNRRRGLRINSLTSSRSKATVINCFTALRSPKECFSGPSYTSSSPIIELNFQRGMRVIQPVTSQRCFGRAKMTANFKLNRSTSNSCKSSFRSLHAKKTRQCFQVRFKLYYQAKISHAKISFQYHFKQDTFEFHPGSGNQDEIIISFPELKTFH